MLEISYHEVCFISPDFLSSLVHFFDLLVFCFVQTFITIKKKKQAFLIRLFLHFYSLFFSSKFAWQNAVSFLEFPRKSAAAAKSVVQGDLADRLVCVQ